MFVVDNLIGFPNIKGVAALKDTADPNKPQGFALLRLDNSRHQRASFKVAALNGVGLDESPQRSDKTVFETWPNTDQPYRRFSFEPYEHLWASIALSTFRIARNAVELEGAPVMRKAPMLHTPTGESFRVVNGILVDDGAERRFDPEAVPTGLIRGLVLQGLRPGLDRAFIDQTVHPQRVVWRDIEPDDFVKIMPSANKRVAIGWSPLEPALGNIPPHRSATLVHRSQALSFLPVCDLEVGHCTFYVDFHLESRFFGNAQHGRAEDQPPQSVALEDEIVFGTLQPNALAELAALRPTARQEAFVLRDSEARPFTFDLKSQPTYMPEIRSDQFLSMLRAAPGQGRASVVLTPLSIVRPESSTWTIETFCLQPPRAGEGVVSVSHCHPRRTGFECIPECEAGMVPDGDAGVSRCMPRPTSPFDGNPRVVQFVPHEVRCIPEAEKQKLEDLASNPLKRRADSVDFVCPIRPKRLSCGACGSTNIRIELEQ